MSNKFIYAGIGSRQTPHAIKEQFIYLGMYFAKNGHILRSGGSAGADEVFETGCDIEYGQKEIYLPWQEFNGHQSSLFHVSDEALYIAKHYHPNWDNVKDPGRKLLGRNVYQALGYNLESPSDFIVCYTPEGKRKGGTGLTLRIAKDRNIPIVDFGLPGAKEMLNDTLREIRKERMLF